MNNQDVNFFCDLTALSQQEREEFAQVTEALFASVQETRELENGFAFRFLNQPGQLEQIAKFVERESQCCPFLEFTLEVASSKGPVWLHITGAEGVKSFLLAELGQLQNVEKL